MRNDDLVAAAQPEVVLDAFERNKEQFDHQHHVMHPLETVRQQEYRGHHISIRTTYTIEVDGVAIEGHVGVTNDGQVHYHAVPNISFSSAVEMVERLIDAFPDDFPAAGPVPDDVHAHHHDEGR